MPHEKSTTNIKVIFALTLIHFTGDFYLSFVNPLLPVFVDRFGLTLVQVGLLAGVSRLLAFLVQPTAGYIADRYQTRFFVLGGLLLSTLFFPLVGAAPGFAALLAFIALGAVGSSMYHPTCAGMIPLYAGSRHAISLAVFGLGGTLAFGLGPLFITQLVARFGLAATPWSMLLGLAVMPYLFVVIPRPQGEGLRSYGFIGSMREAFGDVWQAVALLWVVMVLRSFVSQSFLTFGPIFFARQGHSLPAVGLLAALFTVAGAASGLLAGHLAGRYGHRAIFLASHALACPALLLLLHVRGGATFPAVFLGGFFIMATLPLGLTIGQELAPKGRSMVSSLMMGLAYGTGGMLTPVTGKLADVYSIQTALSVLAFLPIVSLLLIGRAVPRKKTAGGS